MAKGKVFLDHSQPMKDQKTHISKDSGGDIWRITWGLIRIFFLWQSFFLPTPPHLTSRIKWYSFLLVVQLVDNLPAMQETWVQSLEKEMATHSSILAWRIPWMEEPGRLRSMGSQRVRHNWATELNLKILWHCPSLGLEWKLTFSSPVVTAEFPNLLAYSVYHFPSIIF